LTPPPDYPDIARRMAFILKRGELELKG